MQSSNLFFMCNPSYNSFWNKGIDDISPQFNLEVINDQKEMVTLFKVGQLLSRTVSRLYKAYQSQLIYFGENLAIKGVVNLRNVYLKVCERQPSPNLQFNLEITLKKDQNTIFLYCNRSDKIDKFLEDLEAHCILEGFDKNYKVIKQIGVGSSAQVFIAQNLKDQQYYAVKSILKDTYSAKHKDRDKIVNALSEEIFVMRQLDHPNITKLHKVYETETHIQLILNLHQGGHLLDKVQYMSKYDKIKLSQQLLETVAYIHSQGIMHRDLKPQNILFKHKDPNNFEFVICDFGFATFIKQQYHVLYKCGTPGYVAPEIYDYKEKQKMYSEICDVFSLGVIIYELFFGSNPFKGKNKEDTLRFNQQVSLQFDDSVNAPHSLRSLLTAMLRKDPKDRFKIQQCLDHDCFYDQSLQLDDGEQDFEIKQTNKLIYTNNI